MNDHIECEYLKIKWEEIKWRKKRLCSNCEYNNNGWCDKRKTNKGLKDLITCEYRKDSVEKTFEDMISLKEKEYELLPNEYNKGMIDGLKFALKYMQSN